MYNLLKPFHSAFPVSCLLCGQKPDQNSVRGDNFCSHCRQMLPRISTACPICAAVPGSETICGRCLSSPPYFDSSVSVFEFIQPVSGWIYKFKYQHQFHLGKILSLELSRAISARNLRLPDIVVPVPLHKKRLRQRGFNQSAMIAKHVSKKLKIPCKINYLIRHKFSVPQIQLTAGQRRQAVSNAFRMNHKRGYPHIALVDDVVTTGHTVNQAAKALKLGGTGYVSVWSIARNT